MNKFQKAEQQIKETKELIILNNLHIAKCIEVSNRALKGIK